MRTEIPNTFRPAAKAKAESLLKSASSDIQRIKIINQIAESEWHLDRVEWNNWMDMMRGKFSRMYDTPHDRKRHE